MGKKLLIIAVLLVLIIAGTVSGLYFAGVFEEGGLAKLIVGGDDVKNNFLSEEEKLTAEECETPECLFENFNQGCEKSFGEIDTGEQGMVIYTEVAGEKEGKCILNARLLEADGQAAFAIGLEATCLIAPQEVAELEENFDLTEMNCKGPLYEAAKMNQ